MKFGVFYTWLLSLLFTLGVVIILILTVVNWSFQRGFVSYARQNEVHQAEALVQQLSDLYARQGSWDPLRNDHRQWPLLLESAGIAVPPQMGEQPPMLEPVPGLPAPPDASALASNEPDLAVAMLPLAHRMVLLDGNRELLAGPRIPVPDEYWFAVVHEGQAVGWLGLQPIEIVSDELARSFIDQQRLNLIWISLAGLLLALLLASVWARWFLRPIRQVMQGARQLASGDYDSRVPVHGNTELAELAANFNRLARTLARNEQLRRQWIVDISHELRTPIAVIGGEVEAILDGIRQPTPERMAALHSEIGALGKLVDDLHLLSLADQASLKLTLTPVCLTDLVQEQLNHFEPRMAQQGLTLRLEVDSSGPLQLQADARRLSQLVGNLLENSLRYTDREGQVQVRLGADSDRVWLQVQDSAPGVPDGELDKIFDRLYRVDRSRSRALGGSGLGLAICREIVSAHGGSIHAEPSPLGGLSICIELPRKGHSG